MKKNAKRFFSMLLAFCLVFGLIAVPAAATEVEETEAPAAVVEETEAPEAVVEETAPAAETETAEEAEETVVEEKSNSALTLDIDNIDFSFSAPVLMADEDVEIDENDPAIITVTEELKNMTVLNAEGESVPLTEAEIQQILYLYQQYLDHWEANADLLGIQTPFFLSYNDNQDGLGILGEMLVMANIPLAAVRAGRVKASDITGMIENFLYADMLGIQYYGDAIKAARDEISALITSSGALTDVQEYMVINSWLAQNTTFDMPYIMNTGKAEDEKPMVAENPQKHENYDNVYNWIYAKYEEQLQVTFEQNIVNGLKGQMMIEFYKAAIQNALVQGGQTEADAGAFVEANAEAISADPYGFCVTTFGQEAADAIQAQWETTWADWEANGIPGMISQIKLTAYQAAIKDALVQAGQSEADADAFLEANAAAIAADPYSFCVTTFSQEAADQFEAGINGQLTQMGLDPSTETNPEGRVSLAIIVAMQMDTPQQDPMLQKPDGSYMTPNEAVTAFAAQAAAGLTDGVINYWQGSHFGALGRGTAVCLGYTKAFTYLVQYLHPEVYGINGAETDMTVAANWKDAADLYYNADGALDINQNYIVDTVRITFDANVTMYGVTQENFNSEHFWNAVKVDGKWYYIDTCYTDVYTEVMMRDRVETDGYMNHLYFMFSHTTCAQLYEGNYSEIKTLYASAATDQTYEDSWISRVKSNLFFDGGYAYYIYDSTDMVTLMEDYENNNMDADDMNDSDINFVRHKLDTTDTDVDGDTDFETLIQFNYKVDEDSDPVVRVYDPADGLMVENAMLTKLYKQFELEETIYPSMYINGALYSGKLYFNLSNAICSYDLSTGAVALVKEYNIIHGLRDDTKPFGGMAFSVVSSADGADFTVGNHPIAGMTIKDDGKMYVSIATNFAFISGKDPHNSEDQTSFGYEFEESNYNSNYSTYGTSEENESLYESFGYTKEINDNDEFMWSANFVETISMSHLAGTSHTYKAVTVEATCERDGYTENRCTTCGAIEDGSRVVDEGSAHDHHYIYFEEEFYTKAESGQWNTGFCYVCIDCNFSITEPVEPTENSLGEQFGVSYEEQMEAYEKEKAIYDHAVEIAGHVYDATDAEWNTTGTSVTFSDLVCGASCTDRATTIDVLLNDKTITATLTEAVSDTAEITDGYGDCDAGATAVYTASGEAEGYKYAVSTEVKLAAGKHPYANGVCAACGEGKVTRIYGANRYKTAYAAADTLKADLGIEKFENIVVACGTDFADALSGSYLANKKNAPILLVNKNTVDAVTEYIANNLAENGTVYLLGGTVAIPEAMDEALEAAEITFKRLAGENRYETNLLILEEAGIEDEDILVCTGLEFADSLSASATNRPILLVRKTLYDSQKEFLAEYADNKVYIIGGTAAVSTALEEEVETAIGGTATRISGASRYETSVMIAEEFFPEPSFIVLAYGHNFPDGLCGGALAYANGAPLVLTRDTTLTYAESYAVDAAVSEGYVLGGSGLIADETAKSIFDMDETDNLAVVVVE